MQIVWQPKAIKQLKKLGNQQASERIVQAVKSLADYPTVSGLKALTHHEYTHRLRVGGVQSFTQYSSREKSLTLKR